MIPITLGEAFSGLATLVTGMIAGLIFWEQSRARRQEAASMILSEIRHAENAIKRLKDVEAYAAANTLQFHNHSILPINSWYGYRHLFISSLNPDEWSAIDNFYKTIGEMEKQLRFLSTCLLNEITEKSRIIQEQSAYHIFDKENRSTDGAVTMTSFEQGKKIFFSDETAFVPVAPIGLLYKSVHEIQFIMGESACTKLKKLTK